MRFESKRHRIAEKITWNKHVVAAGWLTWDAGSIPAASTILRSELFESERRMVSSIALAKEDFSSVPSYGWQAIKEKIFNFSTVSFPFINERMFYAYVLQSQTDPTQFYRGHTSDLKQRLLEHNAGKCRHTSKFVPWKIKFYAAFEQLEFAQQFEQYLKSGSGHAFSKRHLGF